MNIQQFQEAITAYKDMEAHVHFYAWRRAQIDPWFPGYVDWWKVNKDGDLIYIQHGNNTWFVEIEALLDPDMTDLQRGIREKIENVWAAREQHRQFFLEGQKRLGLAVSIDSQTDQQ